MRQCHFCHVAGCPAEIATDAAFCREHYRALPPNLRTALTANLGGPWVTPGKVGAGWCRSTWKVVGMAARWLVQHEAEGR